MLAVTKAASAHLAHVLNKQGAPEGIAVRFVCEAKGIALRQDRKRDGDRAFQHESRTVLLLDAQALGRLADDTLDVENDELALQHPPEGEQRRP